MVHGEIARTGEESVPRFRPVDVLPRAFNAREGRERIRVPDRRGVGDKGSETFRRDIGIDELIERIAGVGREELGELVFLFLRENAEEMLANLLFERPAHRIEVDATCQRVQIMSSKRLAKAADRIV